MPEIITDNRDVVKKFFADPGQIASRALDRATQDIARQFFTNIKQVQPVGQLDPLVEWAGIQFRDPRPSRRMGNVPIEESWRGGPRIEEESPGSRLVTLTSYGAPHVEFFTTMTGRPHLGTQAGQPQVARNAPTLAFWYDGAPRFPLSTAPHGFNVERDFVRFAWEMTKPTIERVARDVRAEIVEEYKSRLK